MTPSRPASSSAEGGEAGGAARASADRPRTAAAAGVAGPMASARPKRSAAPTGAAADVIVVGAGICGAAAAHFLAARGASVLVLEAGEVAGGSTGRGEGNVLVCDKPPGPERDLALRGRALWERLGEEFPAARVTRKGALLLAAPVGDAPREGTGGPAPGGDPAPESGAAGGWRPAGDLEPALAPEVRVLHEPGDLHVDAPAATRALLGLPAAPRLRKASNSDAFGNLNAPRLRKAADIAAFGNLGGLEVRTAARVAAVEADGVVLADGVRLAAGAVVVATGAEAAALTGLPVEPRKGQLAELAAPPAPIRHKLIEAAYLDTVESVDAGRQLATVVEQTLDGDGVLVGSSRERVGFDAAVDPALTRQMIARAARFVPVLATLPVRREWCGFRPWLPDGLPAIGQLASGVWVSTGHEGSGVCLGPISGLLLASALCGEPPPAELSGLDVTPFDPRRFG
jgi:glycine/D-amino acid oxidase-like deaminating enzyme